MNMTFNTCNIKTQRHVPALPSMSRELSRHLADAGQALRDDELLTFLFSVTDSSGSLVAGCKGEIPFGSAHVSELWVSDEYRGQGLGTQLLKDVEGIALEKDCTRIRLETRNPRAKKLYESLGFVVFGELKEYEGLNSMYYLEKILSP